MLELLRSIFGRKAHASRLDEVRAMSWRQFEAVLREGLHRRGYGIVEEATDRAEEGIDLVVRKHGATFLVRCKQWKVATIGMGPIRELISAVTANDAAGGLFVTAGTFTQEARELAKHANVELLDGAALEQLVLEARLPEPFMDPTEGRRQTSFREGAVEPTCPNCGGAMVKRTGLRGAQEGKDFWECLLYPHCRGRRDA